MEDSTNLTPQQLLDSVANNQLCKNALNIVEATYDRLKGGKNVRQQLLDMATEKIHQGSRVIAGLWELSGGDIILTLTEAWSELFVISEAKRNLSIIGMLMYQRAMDLTANAVDPPKKPVLHKAKPKLLPHTYRYKWFDTHLVRIITLYQFLLKGKMIAPDTKPEDFEAIFSGKASTARVKWLAPQSWLWYLLKEIVEKTYVVMDENSSIWMIASSHFVDKDGRLFTNDSFRKCHEPRKAVLTLDKLVEILNVTKAVPQIDIMDDDPHAELWAGIKDRGWEMNK